MWTDWVDSEYVPGGAGANLANREMDNDKCKEMKNDSDEDEDEDNDEVGDKDIDGATDVKNKAKMNSSEVRTTAHIRTQLVERLSGVLPKVNRVHNRGALIQLLGVLGHAVAGKQRSKATSKKSSAVLDEEYEYDEEEWEEDGWHDDDVDGCDEDEVAGVHDAPLTPSARQDKVAALAVTNKLAGIVIDIAVESTCDAACFSVAVDVLKGASFDKLQPSLEEIVTVCLTSSDGFARSETVCGLLKHLLQSSSSAGPTIVSVLAALASTVHAAACSHSSVMFVKIADEAAKAEGKDILAFDSSLISSYMAGISRAIEHIEGLRRHHKEALELLQADAVLVSSLSFLTVLFNSPAASAFVSGATANTKHLRALLLYLTWASSTKHIQAFFTVLWKQSPAYAKETLTVMGSILSDTAALRSLKKKVFELAMALIDNKDLTDHFAAAGALPFLCKQLVPSSTPATSSALSHAMRALMGDSSISGSHVQIAEKCSVIDSTAPAGGLLGSGLWKVNFASSAQHSATIRLPCPLVLREINIAVQKAAMFHVVVETGSDGLRVPVARVTHCGKGHTLTVAFDSSLCCEEIRIVVFGPTVGIMTWSGMKIYVDSVSEEAPRRVISTDSALAALQKLCSQSMSLNRMLADHPDSGMISFLVDACVSWVQNRQHAAYVLLGLCRCSRAIGDKVMDACLQSPSSSRGELLGYVCLIPPEHGNPRGRIASLFAWIEKTLENAGGSGLSSEFGTYVAAGAYACALTVDWEVPGGALVDKLVEVALSVESRTAVHVSTLKLLATFSQKDSDVTARVLQLGELGVDVEDGRAATSKLDLLASISMSAAAVDGIRAVLPVAAGRAGAAVALSQGAPWLTFLREIMSSPFIIPLFLKEHADVLLRAAKECTSETRCSEVVEVFGVASRTSARASQVTAKLFTDHLRDVKHPLSPLARAILSFVLSKRSVFVSMMPASLLMLDSRSSGGLDPATYFPASKIIRAPAHAEQLTQWIAEREVHDMALPGRWAKVWDSDMVTSDFYSSIFEAAAPVVILLRAGGEEFGGFISVPISKDVQADQYLGDNKCFLFNLTHSNLFLPSHLNSFTPYVAADVAYGILAFGCEDLSIDANGMTTSSPYMFTCATDANATVSPSHEVLAECIEIWVLVGSGSGTDVGSGEVHLTSTPLALQCASPYPVLELAVDTKIADVKEQANVPRGWAVAVRGSDRTALCGDACLSSVMGSEAPMVELVYFEHDEDVADTCSPSPRALPPFVKTFAEGSGPKDIARLVREAEEEEATEKLSDDLGAWLDVSGYAAGLLMHEGACDLLRGALGLPEGKEKTVTMYNAKELNDKRDVLVAVVQQVVQTGSRDTAATICSEAVVFRLLARLGVLCHQEPRRVEVDGESNTEAAEETDPSTKAGSKKGKHYWPKGTGFGFGTTDDNGWSQDEHVKEIAEKERRIAVILSLIAAFVSVDGGSLPPLLESSCLMPVLESYLRNDSLLDMAQHAALYAAIFALIEGLACSATASHLLGPLENQITSLHRLVAKLNTQATAFLKTLKALDKEQGGTADHEDQGRDKEADDAAVAKLITAAHAACQSVQGLQELDKKASKGKEEDTDSAKVSCYLRVMEELQFDEWDLGGVQENYNGHHYMTDIANSATPSQAKMLRLAQEVTSISTSLPRSFGSSVFVRVDETRMDVWQAVIIGPESTPYENGVFLFDIFFPANYPKQPPRVNLATTGAGAVRFNPNLYNCGKVCLSILGTWDGDKNEMWNEKTSTILQVLVSIQSLILVPEPYFNEPGYESNRGTPHGDTENAKYSNNIRVQTVKYAMLEHLKSPPLGFEDVVLAHFWLKRQEIVEMIGAWEVDMGKTGASYLSSLAQAKSDLVAKLSELDVPSILEDEDVDVLDDFEG